MINNKKGLSTVVTTLIIILLVLVAIGIIWIVVRGVIETGTETVNYAVKCLAVDVRATAVNCTSPAACEITLARKAGGDDIGGVKLVFYNDTGSSSVLDSYDASTEQTRNIEPLTSETLTGLDSTLIAPNKVDITVYFLDTAGEDQICGQTNPFSF